jgi:hypothetical protein
MFRLLHKAIFRLQLERRFLYAIDHDLKNAFWVAALRWFYKEAETCR